MNKKIIFSIFAIIVVLGIVFLSQQAYSQGVGKTLISDATNQAKAYLADGSNWAMSNIYPKITGEVQAKGDMIKSAVGSAVDQAQQNVSENVGQKISNYISGITNAVVHPGTPQNCPPTPPSSGQ